MKPLNDENTEEIRLDLNENLFLPKEYYDEIQKRLNIDLSKYPSEYGSSLLNRLSDYYDLIPEKFLVADGSDMII